MKAKTYDDWRLLGFHVKRGEQASGRDPKTGKSTFTRQQVEESYSFDKGGSR